MTAPIYVIDVESTVNAPEPLHKADPLYSGNGMVLAGVLGVDQAVGPLIFDLARDDSGLLEGLFNVGYTTDRPSTLVGHNIKFDLHHLRRYFPDVYVKWRAAGGCVWDTQLAEYLITGQKSGMSSLDELCTKYGLPLKDASIKEMWEAGVKTEDIDRDVLGDYLKHDLEVTKNIFIEQVKVAEALEMLPLIQSQMNALLAVQEMEFNGMPVSIPMINALQAFWLGEVGKHERELTKAIYERMSLLVPSEIKGWEVKQGTKNLQALIYGGTVEITYPSFRKYKHGKSKPCVAKQNISVPSTHIVLTDRSLAEGALEWWVRQVPIAGKIVTPYLAWKKAQKMLSTYLDPLMQRAFAYDDGRVHHTLNQCITRTGRLSSSNPNFQNQPSETGPTGIKNAFSCPEGMALIEMDFKQIELFALAHLSTDETLRADLRAGVDIHAESAKEVWGEVTEVTRRAAKTINFGMIYGGSAKSLAEQANCSVSLTKQVMQVFKHRYPRVTRWWEEIRHRVNMSALPSSLKSIKGLPVRESVLRSETRRMYTFTEYDKPSYGGGSATHHVGFSTTETINYPVQGLATGDIVPLMLGVLMKIIDKRPELGIKMLNTVHDSIIFEVPSSKLAECVELLRDVLNNTDKYYEKVFGIPFSLPLKVECKYGPSWASLAKFEEA